MSYLQLLKALKKENAEKAEKERISKLIEEAEEVSKATQGAEKAEKAEKAPFLKPTKAVSSRYAYPFPDEIEGLGRRHVDALSSCANCETGTWSFYGSWPLCLRCANLGRSG